MAAPTVETAMLPAPVAASPRRRAPVPLVVGGVVVGALFVGPLVYLVVRTLGFGDAALDVLTSDEAGAPLLRTLLLAVTVSAACALLGTACAWLVARTDLPGRRVLRVLFVLPLVIPSFVGAFALQAAFVQGGLLDELFGLGTGIRIEGFWGAFAAITLLS
ncbi:MAG: iron ABC transporter permease, partial [Acidimicrobiia bacterium]